MSVDGVKQTLGCSRRRPEMTDIVEKLGCCSADFADSLASSVSREAAAMLGDRLVMQECLFYQFRLDDHVPADHMLRASISSSI